MDSTHAALFRAILHNPHDSGIRNAYLDHCTEMEREPTPIKWERLCGELKTDRVFDRCDVLGVNLSGGFGFHLASWFASELDGKFATFTYWLSLLDNIKERPPQGQFVGRVQAKFEIAYPPHSNMFLDQAKVESEYCLIGHIDIITQLKQFAGRPCVIEWVIHPETIPQ